MVAYAIQQRVNSNKKVATQVVSELNVYGKEVFLDPLNDYYIKDDFRLWAECVWLAACLVKRGDLPQIHTLNEINPTVNVDLSYIILYMKKYLEHVIHEMTYYIIKKL